MSKGGQFERDISRELSLWWSKGKRDDLFWRSSGSGGRATRRGSKDTAGHCGDICSTHLHSEPMTDLLTIEAKRGYSTDALSTLLDRREDAGQQTWEGWIQQAYEANHRAGSFSWIIIAKRDQRDHIVVMPEELSKLLRPAFRNAEQPPKFVLALKVPIRFRYIASTKKTKVFRKGKWRASVSHTYRYTTHSFQLVAVKYKDFLRCVSPDFIRDLSRKC